MNKLLTLFFLFGLNFIGFSQVKFTSRFELESELYGPLFETFKTGKSLISFRTLPVASTTAKNVFQYFESDSSLQTSGLMEYPVRQGFDMIGYDRDGGLLYVLFQKGKTENPEKYVLKIDLLSKNGFEFEAKNLVPSTLIEFLVLDDKAVLMGVSDSKPVMQILDLIDKSIHTVQGIFADDTKIIQVRKRTDLEAVDVVLSRKGNYRNREFLINTYDMLGNLLQEVKVDEFGEGGQEILDGVLLPDQPFQQFLAGSYGLQRASVYQGLYLMDINEFGEYQFKLYTPEDFPNFFNYLEEKLKSKRDAALANALSKGKMISFPEVFSISATRETREAYYLFFDHLKIVDSKGRTNSGLYSPTGFYRFDRLLRMGYNPTVIDPFYPNRPVVGTSYQIIPEYQYISAHVIKIGKEGNVLWDNAIPYNGLTLVYPNVFAEIAVVGDEVYHAYMEDKVIKMSYLRNGQKVFENEEFELELVNQAERIRDTNPESLKITHWYDRYFLVSGTQEIRFLNEKGLEETKEVFFLTKVLVDGELYQPMDQKD
jgi:hypothetical protein